MKTIIITTIYLLVTSLTQAQDKGNLTIFFEEFEEPQGEIYVAVYKKDNFLRQPTVSTMLKVKTKDNKVVIKDLVYDKYAVSVFHDLNANQSLDMDENQMPLEPWSMSGSVNPMQMPTFEAAQFEISSASKEIALKLFK